VRGRPRIYIQNVDPEAASEFGDIVSDPAEADLALVRLSTPFDPRDDYPLEAWFHAGDLSFKAEALAGLLPILEAVPTVVDIYLDRPAVIPEIAAKAAALTGSFGANDGAWLDIVFGYFAPTGRLPFELPSSMGAVRAQKPDVPHDSEAPLFRIGHGLTY
jgi:beta-glucosidase